VPEQGQLGGKPETLNIHGDFAAARDTECPCCRLARDFAWFFVNVSRAVLPSGHNVPELLSTGNRRR